MMTIQEQERATKADRERNLIYPTATSSIDDTGATMITSLVRGATYSPQFDRPRFMKADPEHLRFDSEWNSQPELANIQSTSTKSDNSQQSRGSK
jgi:hypothetical protein